MDQNLLLGLSIIATLAPISVLEVFPPKVERNTDLAVISLQGKFFINLLDDKCVHVFTVRFKTESDNR